MSARVTTNNNTGLIAHTILRGPIPPLPLITSRPKKATRCTPIPQSPDETNAWCVACRAPMVSHAGKRAGEWECKRCEYRIPFHLKSELRRRLDNAIRMGTYFSNPWCFPCHVPMKSTGGPRKVWKCTLCKKAVAKTSRGYYKCDELPRPQCLTCRRNLRHAGANRWACDKCCYVAAKCRRRRRATTLRPDHPWCVACHYQMKASGSEPKKEWACSWCKASCRKRHHGPYTVYRTKHQRALDAARIDGDELLRFCIAAVPRSFANRDDIAQELVMMILSGQVRRHEVTPLKVRQIGRAIFRSQSEFANISLETPNRDGVRLEERLAG